MDDKTPYVFVTSYIQKIWLVVDLVSDTITPALPYALLFEYFAFYPKICGTC